MFDFTVEIPEVGSTVVISVFENIFFVSCTVSAEKVYEVPTNPYRDFTLSIV